MTTTVALYEYHRGVVDPSQPVRTFSRGALEALDWLYRSNGSPAIIRTDRGTRWITMAYERTRKDGTTYVHTTEYLTRAAF